MWVHNSNPCRGPKGKFTSANAPDVQPVKGKKPVRKHYGEFDKRMEFPDVSPAEAYINSALGCTLGHTYSIARFGSKYREME